MAIRPEKDVLGFQIPIHDIPAVEIFQCTDDLRDVEYESLPRVLDGIHIPDLGQ